jgi:Tfp pilus assembly protein PilF
MILVHLAQAQLASGDNEAARATVGKALEHDPANAAARTMARQLR